MTFTTVVMTFLVLNPLLAAPEWSVSTKTAADGQSVDISMSVTVDIYTDSMEVQHATFEANGCKSEWDVQKTVNQKFINYPGALSSDENDNCTLLLDGRKMGGTVERSLHTLEVTNDINAMNGVNDSNFVIVNAKFEENDSILSLTLWTVERKVIDAIPDMGCASLSIVTNSKYNPFRLLI